MNFPRSTTALFAATATLVLAACASPEGSTQQTAAEERNPCIGVAPTTGSMLRRKEDCSRTSSGRDASTQETIDKIRNTPDIGRSPVTPTGR